MSIIDKKQDPEVSQSLLTKQATNKNNTVLTALFVGAFSIALLLPQTVEAKPFIFDFLGTVFAQAKKEKRISILSSNKTFLRAAVHVDPNPAKGGADIEVVDGKALVADFGSVGKSLAPQNKDAISLYVVREGDSLSQVAKLFDVSVNTIVWANDLRNAKAIRPGQVLVILPVSGVRHTIKKGDTIASLAKKYKVDAEEISVFNGLSDDTKLAIGDEVIVPGGEIARPKSSKKISSGRIGTARIGSGRTSPLRGAGGPSYPGYYTNPLSQGVMTQNLHGYNAVDIGAPFGTPIVAAASGTVILSRSGGWNGGYGTYVVVRHENGTQTLYAHNSRNIVGVGQYVVKGQVIAYVGSTGRSTGPHVHFEVRGAKNPLGR